MPTAQDNLLVLEDGSGFLLMENGDRFHLEGATKSIAMRGMVDFQNVAGGDWAPYATTNFRVVNAATLSIVDDPLSATGRVLKTVSPDASNYSGWAIDNVPCYPGGNWRYRVWFNDTSPGGTFLFITEVDYFNSVGGYLGNHVGWWAYHNADYAFAEVGGAAPAGTHHATLTILHDHLAFESRVQSFHFWNEAASITRPNKNVTGVLSFAGAIAKSRVSLRTWTGGLSFSGAVTTGKAKVMKAILDFNDLLADFLPRTNNWSITGTGTTVHKSKEWVAEWPFDAGFTHAQSATSTLDNINKLNISPKVNIDALSPARARAWFRDSAGSGYPFDLALLIYDASDNLLGWWYTVWGSATWELAEVEAPSVYTGQAKAAVGFRSNTNGVTVSVSDFGIANLTPPASGRLKNLTGVLSFAGQVATRRGKNFVGVLSFTGSALRQTFRTFTGNLGFTGALSKVSTRTLAGTLSFSGSVAGAKKAVKALAGGLSFSGAFLKSAIKPLTGTLSFTGAATRVKQAVKSLAGGLSFTGAVSRLTGKTFTGGLSFSGLVNRLTGKTFPGQLSFSGALSRNNLRSFTAALGFSGLLSRKPAKNLAGVLSFSGNLVKRTARGFTGVLSFAGAMVPHGFTPVQKAIAGTLSFTGSIKRSTTKSLGGNLSFNGLVTRLTGRQFTGGLSFSGALQKRGSRFMTGAVSFAGSLKKAPRRLLTGGLSFSGLLGRTYGKTFTANLSFSGALRGVFAWMQVQARVVASILTMFHWPWKTIGMRAEQAETIAIRHQESGLQHRSNYNITIRVKGPIEMAYKRGTNILFEATFTDKNGGNFDPDPGTIKLYVKTTATPPVYLTGYDRATGGKAMTKTAVGVYEADWQSLLNDAVGRYEVEMEGFIGVKRFLDSVFVQLKA